MKDQTEAADGGPAAMTGLAAEYADASLRMRMKAQKEFAADALARLNEIAMDENQGAVQVSAIRELLEQVLGRAMPVFTFPAKQDDDWRAAVEARGAELAKKLERIAHSETETAAADGTE